MISATGKVLPVVMEGRERAVVSLTKNVGAVSKATVGKLLRGGAHMGFFECIDTILN